MKRISHVFENLLTPNNLELAILSSSRHKTQKSKMTQAQIEWVQNHTTKAVQHMQKQLLQFETDPINTIIFKHHETCIIHDDSCNKDRVIVKPPFLYEQIYHHAVIQVIQPIISRGMYEYSCGSIPGRGADFGRYHMERFIRNNPRLCKYYLKIDIHHFFQNIDHSIMLAIISRYVKDVRYINLISQLIDSYHDTPGKGLPIGYYTSQWFANLYLQSFDHFVKEQLHAPFFIRYMDDMVILGPNKRELERMHIHINEYLNGINLHLNDKTSINKLADRPIDFMGYKFYYNRTTLRKNIMVHATRLAKRIGEHGYSYMNCCRELSLLGWIGQTDSYNVYLEYIKPYIKVGKMKQVVSKRNLSENYRLFVQRLIREILRERKQLKYVYSMMAYEGVFDYYVWIEEVIDLRGEVEIMANEWYGIELENSFDIDVNKYLQITYNRTINE